MDAGRTSEHLFCQRHSHVEDMLAAVEYEQHFLVAKGGNQPRNWVVRADGHAEHEGESARHKKRVGQRREIDETNAVIIGRHRFVRHC